MTFFKCIYDLSSNWVAFVFFGRTVRLFFLSVVVTYDVNFEVKFDDLPQPEFSSSSSVNWIRGKDGARRKGRDGAKDGTVPRKGRRRGKDAINFVLNFSCPKLSLFFYSMMLIWSMNQLKSYRVQSYALPSLSWSRSETTIFVHLRHKHTFDMDHYSMSTCWEIQKYLMIAPL